MTYSQLSIMSSSSMKLHLFSRTTTTASPFRRSLNFQHYTQNQCFASHSRVHSLNVNPPPPRRHIICHLSPADDAPNERAAWDLPILVMGFEALPFVPCERRTIPFVEKEPSHLKLLEQALSERKLFVATLLLDFGCLVMIENVERVYYGVLVTVRAICRVQADDDELYFQQSVLRCKFVPIKDEVPQNVKELSSKVAKLKEALWTLHNLEIKLKKPKEDVVTYTANTLAWAEKETTLEYDDTFIPSLEERISFIAFQPVAGLYWKDEMRLVKEKSKALLMRDTLRRLQRSLEVVKSHIAVLALRVALEPADLE